jgi:hypothetical protein
MKSIPVTAAPKGAILSSLLFHPAFQLEHQLGMGQVGTTTGKGLVGKHKMLL